MPEPNEKAQIAKFERELKAGKINIRKAALYQQLAHDWGLYGLTAKVGAWMKAVGATQSEMERYWRKGRGTSRSASGLKNPSRGTSYTSYMVYPGDHSLPKSFGDRARAKQWAQEKANESGRTSIIFVNKRGGKPGKSIHVKPKKRSASNPRATGLSAKWITAKARVIGNKVQLLVPSKRKR